MTDKTAQRRFMALDGWRGIAAPLIAIFHFHIDSPISMSVFVRHSWMLVDFFFVLSGFVITHAYAGRLESAESRVTFLTRRFARLWPLHVTMLGLFILLELYRYATTGAGFTGDRSVFAIVTNLALLQSMHFHEQLTWNTPSWAVSTEFYTYIVFAMLCGAALTATRRVLAAFFAITGSLAVLIFVSRYGMHETFDFGFFRCLYGFFAGVLVYEAWRRWQPRPGTFGEIAAVVIAVIYLLYAPGHTVAEYFAVPVFAIMVFVFAGDSGAVSRLLAARPVEKLALWSLAIYLVQMFIITLIFSALDTAHLNLTRMGSDGSEMVVLNNPLLSSAVTLIYLAVVIAVGALACRYIEIPAQRLFHSTEHAGKTTH
jgi:peptidoglycan/LPS O-acetylase OafA/YrhL